jgi:hypothetical protein
MASGLTGGKTTRLADAGVGGPVDLGQYTVYGSQVTDAAFQQPFWDVVNWDENGKAFGISGDLFSSNPWDVVKINGSPLPGKWTATATPALQLDVQKPNGYDGAALVQKGYVPAGITITGIIWTPDQWARFLEMIPTFWRAANKWALNDVKKQQAQIVGQQLAVSISHPGLAPLAIGSMVIYQLSPPEDSDQVGAKQIKMLARQYIPTPPKKQSAVKTTRGTGGAGRSVQAQLIAQEATLLAGGGFSAALKAPSIANAPLPPSLMQAGFKPLKLPNYAGR